MLFIDTMIEIMLSCEFIVLFIPRLWFYGDEIQTILEFYNVCTFNPFSTRKIEKVDASNCQ